MKNTELTLDQLADVNGGSMHQGAMNSLTSRGFIVGPIARRGLLRTVGDAAER
ncbi:hypothetical protein [Prochlorococcus marinus]|uniref:hypothetical protein n=1 Tax=Prochlorococcus marinus TaxID=1219 RepID=UPI0022B3E7F8|nr:hypothetical protein [Prochlorococcus marinus]